MRWVIGDVHGCAAELESLLAAIRFDPAGDELWSVGDLVNSGPESLAVLRLWRQLGGRAVVGNHDAYALQVHAGRVERRADTLDELLAAPDRDQLMDFLRSLPALSPLPATDGGRDAWIVHAGLHPEWSDLRAIARRLDAAPRDETWLERPEVRFATRVRCCRADGERQRESRGPEHCRPPYRPWDAFLSSPGLVVHGHWAARGHYRGPSSLGLDSGCVYGGALTAWCQEEDRIVQVPARRAYVDVVIRG